MENKIGKIEKRDITDELKESYLDYAMSVIVSRALPDVRDGLKPVQRRILWAMWDMGLTHAAKFIKSARVVGECFVKNTFVATDKGLVPIQDVSIGDLVFTHNNLKPVVRLYKMPPRPLLKITLSNGVSVTTTLSQKLKIFNQNGKFEWKETKDLQINEWLTIRSVYPDFPKEIRLTDWQNKPKTLNQNIAYILGMIISDGWITADYSRKKHKRIGICSGEIAVIQKLVGCFNQEFGYSPTIETKKYKLERNGQIIENKIYVIRINRKSINDYFIKEFNIPENFKAATKFIPAQIFISPKDIIFSFISGLIDGDGSVNKQSAAIIYASISERLINQLQIILQHLGIFSQKYSARKLTNGKINRRRIEGNSISHTLEITGLESQKLANQLNLVSKLKYSRLKKILEMNTDRLWSNFGTIPYGGKIIFSELSQTHLGGGWYQDANGEKFRMGIHYQGGGKLRYSSDLKEKTLRLRQIVEFEIAQKLQKINSPISEFIESLINKKIAFLKIVKIDNMPAEETYDLEIPDDHEFIANGIVSHNCMGKYHPHGDMAIYDAMVRMAQDFSLRCPLIQGQGNFGNIDGDNAAAQRYTEARLSKISEELLIDIEKETVDWQPNYDATRNEPKVLPAKIPNLLINGVSGIAVGMATSIPPHNLSEVIEATAHLIENPKSTTEELTRFVQGPDFPTGGIIYDKKAIVEAYSSGRGPITIRAKTEITERGKGQFNIIINEIPYQVNKAELIIKIAELITEKKIEGIRDVRDESDREGMRIVIELKTDIAPQKILNSLFQHTDLQKDFHLNMIALIKGIQPQLMSLKDILAAFVEHRKEVVKRRAEFDLKKAKERAHILEGLIKALDVIDKIIATIKKSKNAEEAHKNLVKNFKLTDIQAAAILEMKLRTLAALERQKIEDELGEKKKLIKELEMLLKSPQKILAAIKNELLELKKNFGDNRRTQVVAGGLKEFKEEDLILLEETVIALSHSGYIKRLSPDSFKAQRRGGKGLIGGEVSEEDFIEHFLSASTHDNILFFTNKGKVFQTKVYEIPVGSRIAKGKLIQNFLEIPSDEKITAVIGYSVKGQGSKINGQFLVMATKNGIIKKTALEDFSNVRRSGIIAVNLKDKDELRWVKLSSGKDEIILTTELGQSIRFKETKLRAMGRTASGVTGIKLRKAKPGSERSSTTGNDFVSGFDIIKKDQRPTTNDQRLLIVMENGFAKQTPLKEYRLQNRGGSGIKTAKITSKTGKIVSAQIIDSQEELLALSTKGQIIKTEVKSVRTCGRATSGVRIMKLKEGDKVAGVATL